MMSVATWLLILLGLLILLVGIAVGFGLAFTIVVRVMKQSNIYYNTQKRKLMPDIRTKDNAKR